MKYVTVKRTFLVIFFALSWIGCISCSSNHTVSEGPGKEIVLRLEPKPGNPRNSEGDFIRLKDGRILFVYTHFTGGAGDNSGAYLAGRYSRDDGKTWTKKDVMILPNEGRMNIMSVSLLRLKNGKIALFYLRKNSVTDCIPYMRISSDETKTWSQPKRCIDTNGYYVVNNDRLVQLPGGRIIFPTALHDAGPVGKIMCYYSDNNGETWTKSQQVANPDNIVLQEPGIVALKNGKIMMFCRTESGVQYFSFSGDQGETWTPVVPGNIKSPLSPASIERIPATGDLLLIWNNNYEPGRDGGKRTPYNLAVSKDDGKHWIKVKSIESDPAGWYCYTAIEFVGNHVLLGHCAGNTRIQSGLSTTHITRLSLDWVYRDATAEPLVISDNHGVVKLACKDKKAHIYYTLDGTLPTSENAVEYGKPIVVTKLTNLYMQASLPGKTNSQIVFAQVGKDIYQKARHLSGNLMHGLSYQYYECETRKTDNIMKYQPVKTGVALRFSTEKRQQDSNFAFVFKGYIKVPQDGLYTFYLESNDGSVLYLDDDKLINNDGPHGAYEEKASVSLRKGMHKVEVKYFQLGGGQSLKISWSGPGFEKTTVSPKVLFHQ